MRTGLIIILAFVFSYSYGQDFVYPSIRQTGKDLKDFIPAGWMMLDSAAGDLNRDGHNDAVIILQYRDSVEFVKSAEDTVITQPRILVIVFRQIADKAFRLVQQSNTFVLNHDNPGLEDPYQEITITKGIMEVSFQIFANMGSWYVTNASYKFRYQNAVFSLIGADYSSWHRATGEYENYSYNFLTKKRSLERGNESSGSGKKTWKALNIPQLKTLKTLKSPFTWEVEKGIIL